MERGNGLRFCGHEVTREELDLIVDTARDCAGLSATELAHTVCELLDWRRPNGRLKAHECRQFLEELAFRGLFQLSGQGRVVRKRDKKPPASADAAATPPEPVTGSLRDLGPVELEAVSAAADRRLWRDWVGRHHYLGCPVPFGAHLRYFVRLMRPQPQRVGCVQVSSPAWRMAPRDGWIGWSDAERAARLQWIVQNSRFLILPWVRVPYLASTALAVLTRRIVADWEACYSIRPVLMETLVDAARFRGTCYRAANWVALGLTTGRGRMDREHLRHGAAPKEVLVYPLCRKAREKLRTGALVMNRRRGEEEI
jgi:hypothetical protein